MLAFCRRRPSVLAVHVASCRLFSAFPAQATTIEDHTELIRQITSLGSLSKYKETAELVRGIPLDPLIQAAIQNFKDAGKGRKSLTTVGHFSLYFDNEPKEVICRMSSV